MNQELAVGDVLQLRNGPFTSNWKVVEIKEHGAVLRWDVLLHSDIHLPDHLLHTMRGNEMNQELAVGDILRLKHGPFTSDWKVVEIKEHGAVLEFVGMIQFAGFRHLISAPNGKMLTHSTNQEWLGRSHFASVRRTASFPGHH